MSSVDSRIGRRTPSAVTGFDVTVQSRVKLSLLSHISCISDPNSPTYLSPSLSLQARIESNRVLRLQLSAFPLSTPFLTEPMDKQTNRHRLRLSRLPPPASTPLPSLSSSRPAIFSPRLEPSTNVSQPGRSSHALLRISRGHPQAIPEW